MSSFHWCIGTFRTPTAFLSMDATMWRITVCFTESGLSGSIGVGDRRCYLQQKFSCPELWSEPQPNAVITDSTGFCPSFSDPSAAGETLQRARHEAHWHQSVLHVAVWHSAAGAHYGLVAGGGSIAVAALAIIMLTNSLQLTVGWCWQRDRGLHLKHILSRCGGGNPHKCKSVHWWTIKEAYSSKTALPLSSVGCRGNNVF